MLKTPKKIWHKKTPIVPKVKAKKKPTSKAKKLVDAPPSPTLGEAERANFQSTIDGLKDLNLKLGLRVVELEKWIDIARKDGMDFSSAEAILHPAVKPVIVLADPPKDDSAA